MADLHDRERDHDEQRADIIVTEGGKVLKNRQGPRSVNVMVVKADGSYVMNSNRSDQ